MTRFAVSIIGWLRIANHMSALRRGAIETTLNGCGNLKAVEFILVGERKEGPMFTEVVLPLVKSFLDNSVFPAPVGGGVIFSSFLVETPQL